MAKSRQATLESVLYNNLPDDMLVENRSSINQTLLGDYLGITRQGVNAWIHKERMSISTFDMLMSMPGNTFTPDDLAPFCEAVEIALKWIKKHEEAS